MSEQPNPAPAEAAPETPDAPPPAPTPEERIAAHQAQTPFAQLAGIA